MEASSQESQESERTMEASSQESELMQESERAEASAASSEDSSPSRAAARGLRHRAKVVYNEKQLAKRASTDDPLFLQHDTAKTSNNKGKYKY